MSQRGKITLLLFFFSVCATATLVHHYREMRPEWLRPADLYDVVLRQLEDCRTNNYSSAYSHVSYAFQQHCPFGAFSGMMQADYSRILATERVELGPWERHGRRAIVQVFFVGRDGSVFPCVYTLVSEGDGWKIDGTRWVRGWPRGQRMRGTRV